MKSDKKIQEDVMAELQWEPMLNAAEIGVAVNSGVVTLSGNVSSYMKKRQAELAAKRVKDVRAVAIDINVDLWPEDNSNDTEIGTAIVDVFRWNALVPDDKIQTKVENCWVTLEGEVEWQYQKTAAYDAVNPLRGIKGISNLIHVKPAADKVLVKDAIKKALERNADVESDKIAISTAGHKVTLSGKAGSWHEKGLIERAAWSSPGVAEVIDDIEIA
ncbi:BON domain-containing protein [Taibaiella helva]|uniref:BON domain-containing protein n=1 Tax=Taibaiella helva TaxID=2301235 RepID=UPI000E57FDB3|nr:BON domain-containing protein [Taibaiella helva]